MDVVYILSDLFQPKVTMSNKNGRFVIGANFDLYVLDAKTTDSSMATLNFREYGTLTTFAYRQAPIKVLNAPFQGGTVLISVDSRCLYIL